MPTRFQILAISLAAAIGGAAPAPRALEGGRLQLLDRDWRFHRGDAPGAQKLDFDDSSWRSVDVPHDWSIEDLPAPEGTAAETVSIVAGRWRFKEGDDAAWKAPGFDDASWSEVTLPAAWEKHSGYTKADAYGWYRRKIAIPDSARGKDIVLDIGKIDDVDETFLNGVKIGGTGTFPPAYGTAWDRPRRYGVAKDLIRGDGSDVIAVRVFDGNGDGGIYAASSPRALVRGGPFDPDLSAGGRNSGYTVGGVGWYRKAFATPDSLRGKRIAVIFEGVYMNAEVWINGERLGEQPYGYTTFRFDVTERVRFGGERNVLAVRVDTNGDPSRWYHGSGVYRHVWLTATDPIHVEHDGVFVTTPEVSAEKALVRVETAVRNDGGAERAIRLTTSALDTQGKAVASSTATQAIAAGSTRAFVQELAVAKPALWSPDSPTLYRLVTEVANDATVVDRLETPFGIRSVAIDSARGLLLNGAPLKLRGGCVHHDNGPLGAASFDRAEERRVELLKASGYNAIRTSHNPPAPGLLDACDRLGLVVIDEAFDCWSAGKTSHDYSRFFAGWWERDLDALVLRDRNHPSVIVWSIGNEIPGQEKPEFFPIAKQLADRVRRRDPTRPVTVASQPADMPRTGGPDGFFAAIDVRGYNYQWLRYDADAKRTPPPPTIGTESFPLYAFEQWMGVLDHPHVIGDFVWTAMDYLGEAALGYYGLYGERPGRTSLCLATAVFDRPGDAGAWRAPFTGWRFESSGADQDKFMMVSAGCGDLDLCGFKRPPSYYRDVLWGIGCRVSAFVHPPYPADARVSGSLWGWPDVRASWTWPGLEGKPLAVDVYSSCPNVRLLLNGRDLGTKPADRSTRFVAAWQVPYESGTLVAVGLDGAGAEIARWEIRTAGTPACIRLTPDRATIRADGQDLSYVTVEILDERGVIHPDADALVRFRVTGAGTIIGVCSGDTRSFESFKQPQRKAFRGRCLVVIKAGNAPGAIEIEASAARIRDAKTVIDVKG